MKGVIIKVIALSMLLVSSLVYACGDNPNAMVQGPFKDSAFNNGVICFQNSPDKRDVDFYQSYSSVNGNVNNIIDTFSYSDAPVEVSSVFFTTIAGKRNVVVLLRWNVNYFTDGVQYSYHYEVKAYNFNKDSGYELFLDSDRDPNLSGFQTKDDEKVSNYKLDNARKIKKYLHSKYGD
ncbi:MULTISPECIES: hypothetical protein [unclassified Enterobacter]|uniref:hypothetical protein n=1 Tax=unclassified Enterobacter TaxID=2608935 RepID=UPI0003ED0E33|nr:MULTISPECIES: hypothetical protein [unclassified Enterobacter]EWG64818.1 hypothetical protein P348_04620 [Enterobacter sp. DC3]EWG75083.1 hypothetical protein P349_02452 [Enterobacter sp. DC4]